MQIAAAKNNPNFKGFNPYLTSAGVEKNAMLNRAIVEAGGTVPWVLLSNNNEEKRERKLNLSLFFGFAFLAPVITVPLANRFIVKNLKLAKTLFAKNQKTIQLSNKYLVSAEKTKEGLEILAKRAETDPFEAIYSKLTGKKPDKTLNIKELLAACNNDYEVLRKKLINAKNAVLCSDLFVTGATLGSLGFINNYITKKKTGRSGFSAELEMADGKIISQRADFYERTKKTRFIGLAAIVCAVSTALPLMLKKGLTSQNISKFNTFVKKHASKMDYTKGVYMSRWALAAGLVMNVSGLYIASRNKTELKDWTIRTGVTIPIFFGADIFLGGLFAGICDKLFKTELTNKTQKTSVFRKIFPQFKSIAEINELVENKKTAPKNLKIATGLYWLTMILSCGALAYLVPTIVNKIIKRDVAKDVERYNTASQNTSQSTNNSTLQEFLEKIKK